MVLSGELDGRNKQMVQIRRAGHKAAPRARDDYITSMTISLSDTARNQSIASIRRYFAEELEQDVGDLKAGLLLEFFLKEIAPTVYNGAIDDAQAFIAERVADLGGACAAEEFAYWPRASVRRSSR